MPCPKMYFRHTLHKSCIFATSYLFCNTHSRIDRYNRDWQYHQDLKLWFKRGSSTDGISTTNNQYIYFDIKLWECRLFSGPHADVTGGLLPEDEIRVKLQAA
mmetsp:Transcript_31040/g.96038  ORF Transcript_31040/g.96038 Transcript_31040/m.96038 type:complete len:102 (+) Transcript_31040:1588-1893(+)